VNAGRFRIFHRRMGQDVRAWPMLVLLLVVVAGAIACVLWFMREAMHNERLAVRQKLADAYRGQLVLIQKRAEEEWWRGLARFDEHEPGPALFAQAVREGWADSVVCFDAAGRAVYPQTNGQTRSAEANAELLALERDRQNQELTERLRRRVNDYESNALPSAQRRFLMRELQRLAGGDLATLDAEELAARYLETQPVPVLHDALRATDVPGVWAASSPGKRALALFTTARLRQEIEAFVRDPTLAAEVRITAIAPGDDALRDAAFVTSSLAPMLPGWRLALSLDDRALFDTAADKRVTTYLWIGSAVIAAMSVLAVLIARGFGRQVRLTRLKNDLVATVSHELKTPLTAMRALVETLLDAEKLDEKTTREYLQMLARENARLSRLIDNFLTFSRLERNKFNFAFAPLEPQAIVESAVAAMGERCETPACRFEARTAANLPAITGDFDALVTALLNLLDNAWKYSGDDKRILLRTEAANGSVQFSVEDNGIGLSPRESRHVFRRFYQADDKLSRVAGGCGLGLSIVRSIVEAHRGSVRVASEAGRGSTFTIEIPAAS
jgi:signal transduction histidine kinase